MSIAFTFWWKVGAFKRPASTGRRLTRPLHAAPGDRVGTNRMIGPGAVLRCAGSDSTDTRDR